jgi:hypothetical protein
MRSDRADRAAWHGAPAALRFSERGQWQDKDSAEQGGEDNDP